MCVSYNDISIIDFQQSQWKAGRVLLQYLDAPRASNARDRAQHDPGERQCTSDEEQSHRYNGYYR